MSYSAKRKLGRRKVEAAAGYVNNLHQRVALAEAILSKLLAREGLVLGNFSEQGFDLVPAPPPAEVEEKPELEMSVIEESAQ